MLTIPKPPTPDSLRLLLRAKMMLSHALEHSNQRTEFDNMVAILSLDNAIEYLVRTVVYHLDLESVTRKSFDIPDLAALTGSVNQALIDSADVRLPYLADIKLLRKIRNLVQHGAVAPNADLDRYSRIADRFFAQILQLVFGLKLDQLSISSIIENEQTKGFLIKAERYIDAGKWLDAIVQTRNAFENEYFNHVKHLDISLSLYPSLIYAKERQDIAKWGFDAIKCELELNCLGINDPDYRRFKEYLDHIPREYCPEDSWGQILMQRDWKREDAVYCYSYTTNVLLRWQAKEKELLYMPKSDKKYVFNETIAGINITKESESGCSYFYEGNQKVYLFYTSKAIKRRFEKTSKNRSYKYRSITYIDGKRDSVREEEIEILGQYVFLITNEPERWGIVIWYRSISGN